MEPKTIVQAAVAVSALALVAGGLTWMLNKPKD
jgi:hypothetical protein